MRERMGPHALVASFKREAPKWWALAPELPTLMHEVLRRSAAGEHAPEHRAHEFERLRREMRTGQRRTYVALGGGSLLIAGALLLSAPPSVGMAEVGWVVGSGGLVLLLLGWPRRHA
jgi:ubiquinone biosynthesis protein